MTIDFNGPVFGTGIALGVVSMLSVGPNNLMLIREGLARGRVARVATTVWSSYAVLLVLAMLFADLSQSIGQGMRLWLSWLGLAAITWFAFGALRVALSAGGHQRNAGPEPARVCLRRALAVVWLNPLTYLELLLIPAAFCATLNGLLQRSEFVAAVLTMAAVTCYGYAFGGSYVGLLIRDRRTIRLFDLGSGVLLSGAAVSLAVKLIRGLA